MRDVLVVVDIQNDFLPGGALAVPDGDAVVPLVNDLATRYEHVVLTQDWHPPHHRSFASSHPGFAIARAELIVRKGFRVAIDSYSTFCEAALSAARST